MPSATRQLCTAIWHDGKQPCVLLVLLVLLSKHLSKRWSLASVHLVYVPTRRPCLVVPASASRKSRRLISHIEHGLVLVLGYSSTHPPNRLSPLALQSTQYLLSSNLSNSHRIAWCFSCNAFCLSCSVFPDITHIHSPNQLITQLTDPTRHTPTRSKMATSTTLKISKPAAGCVMIHIFIFYCPVYCCSTSINVMHSRMHWTYFLDFFKNFFNIFFYLIM